MTPQRIQRKRTKGWRMPKDAVYVGRPTKWGNPLKVVNGHRQGWLVWDDRDRYGWVNHTTNGPIAAFPTKAEAIAAAVATYAAWAKGFYRVGRDPMKDIYLLRGRDLVCWCPLDQPCHADVLLELANREACCLDHMYDERRDRGEGGR